MSAKLKVLAKRNGFRRAGIEFSDTEAKIIEIGSLTKEQVEAIKADPNLVVVEGESFDDKPGTGARKAGDAELVKREKALESGFSDLEKKMEEISKEQDLLKKASDDLADEKQALLDAQKQLKEDQDALAKAQADFKKETSKQK